MLDSYTNDTPDFQLISINLFNGWSFDMKFAEVQDHTYSWNSQIEIHHGFEFLIFDWSKFGQINPRMLCYALNSNELE